MLNGLSPILIINFSDTLPENNPLSGIPVVGEFIAQNIGIPIPIYLDEDLSGIYVEDESLGLSVETNIQRTITGRPIVDQAVINSALTVNMLANKDSIALPVLIAMNDYALTKLINREYSITYLNGPIAVFNGLLNGFNVTPSPDTDLLRVSMQIVKVDQEITPSAPTATIQKVTAPIP